MQRAEVKGEGHVVHEYRSLEDVRVLLLERGLDVTPVRAQCVNHLARRHTDAAKKFGPAHGRRRDEFCAINTGAQWLTVSQIVPWSTQGRADWVRNDPVLTTRG
jgi:hypothetical protein